MESTRIIKIKPLSVNKCWQGRRFKTPTYKAYEKQVMALLPDDIQVPEGKLSLFIRWGLSSKLSDWDNPVKPFQDILQKHYEFDDRYIYLAMIEKIDVDKGEEFIEFQLKGHTEDDVMIVLTKLESRILEETLEDMLEMIKNGEDFVDDISERVAVSLNIIRSCNIVEERKILEELDEESKDISMGY